VVQAIQDKNILISYLQADRRIEQVVLIFTELKRFILGNGNKLFYYFLSLAAGCRLTG